MRVLRAHTRFLAVLGLVLTALLVTACSGGDSPSDSGGGFVTGDGSLTRVAVDQRKPAPVISGPQLGTDKTVTSADYAGKVIVVNVWGSWCSPCRAEASGLQQASEDTKDVARFLGINSRDSGEANGEAFQRAFGVTYPSVYDPSGSQLVKFENLPPSAVPSTVVIDEQGRVAARVLGTISPSSLVALVDDVAAGK